MPAATLLALLLQQPGAWGVAPARPTVGDTIWLVRTVSAPAGWRVRPGPLAGTPAREPLGEPTATPGAGGWVVRYPLAAWTPGPLVVAMPPLWRVGPDGSADSLPGGTAAFTVASVIPDTVRAPAPQPALGPLAVGRRTAFPLVAALLVAAGMLVALAAWRRRPTRAAPPAPAPPPKPPVPDTRWLNAGEPRAVAARATHDLRAAIARAVPAAHEALATLECLAAVEQARADAPVKELRELLGALDQVAFAASHATDVAPLAARARTLAERLAR